MNDGGVAPPRAPAHRRSTSGLNVLVVEDDEDMRRLIEKVLVSRGHHVEACGDAEHAWTAYQRERYPLVVLDWRLPGMDGLELCRLIRSHPTGDRSIIVMITACDQVGDLNEVLEAGANDYMAKPVGLDLLHVRLRVAEQWARNIEQRHQAEATVQRLARQLEEKSRFHDLIGTSPAMRHVYEQVQAFAPAETTVLIEGETGTGKEMVARAIHVLSTRKDGPFVAVNCAALSESLLASQLFGHKKGAFTGALDHQQGFFEAANGGTLFLDEIGDVSPAVQKSLLRVLQDKTITRVGESKPRTVDVRILAATHHRLAEDVSQGSFRADLLYRIRVARIHLPALRERPEDIPLLVTSFLVQCAAAMGKAVREVSVAAMKILTCYPWPGNVRELKSAIEAAVLTCRSDVIQADDLPPEIVRGELLTPSPHVKRSADPKDEADRIREALERAHGNRTLAARLLGMSRATFYRRLTDLGLLLTPSPDA